MKLRKIFFICAALAAAVCAMIAFVPAINAAVVAKTDGDDVENGVVKQLRSDIVAARENIKKEMAAIQDTRHMLSVARKAGDAAKVEAASQDIARRDGTIQALKKEIADKKAQVQGLTHSRQSLPSTRHRSHK